MRVALVHDWLTGMRGGEKVLLALLEIFPDADLFTLVYEPEKVDPAFRARRVTPSFLQRIPGGVSHYRHFLPFYRGLMGGFDLSGYDLIVSSSSACAKWVRNPKGVPHVCYCHSPMRYIWDLFDDYFGKSFSPPVRWAARRLRPRLQAQDLASNRGVTHFVANSTEVRDRIRRLYGREAEVIHPPVDVGNFDLPAAPKTHFLVVSALVPYKRVDLAVSVCSKRDWPLVVVGKGSEEARLRKMAGPTVRFAGWAEDKDLPGHYARARALLFPGLEDFGIVPVESLAAGVPVVAFGRGGVLDTVEDGKTGVLFPEQTPDSLEAALERFAGTAFDARTLKDRAASFSKQRFLARMRDYLRRTVGYPS